MSEQMLPKRAGNKSYMSTPIPGLILLLNEFEIELATS
jgi:hypothetical protein